MESAEKNTPRCHGERAPVVSVLIASQTIQAIYCFSEKGQATMNRNTNVSSTSVEWSPNIKKCPNFHCESQPIGSPMIVVAI